MFEWNDLEQRFEVRFSSIASSNVFLNVITCLVIKFSDCPLTPFSLVLSSLLFSRFHGLLRLSVNWQIPFLQALNKISMALNTIQYNPLRRVQGWSLGF